MLGSDTPRTDCYRTALHHSAPAHPDGGWRFGTRKRKQRAVLGGCHERGAAVGYSGADESRQGEGVQLLAQKLLYSPGVHYVQVHAMIKE
eukprot:3367773-Prymnesium_polylepis.1